MGKGYVSSVLLFISTNERYTLNLSDYDSVTKYQNLRYFISLNIIDPNYMPVTRDISPSNQRMILEWLDNPIRNITQILVSIFMITLQK